MEDLGFIVRLAVLALAVVIPVGFFVKLVACMFSPQLRQSVVRRPVLHLLWALATAVVILLPVLSRFSHPVAAPRADAECVAVMLEAATKAYVTEYGCFPLQTSGEDHVYAADQAALVAVLCGDASSSNANPRGICFLDLPRERRAADGTLADPWRNRFHVVADWSRDGVVQVGTSRVPRSVAVWSNGPNGDDELGAGDDVTSWE